MTKRIEGDAAADLKVFLHSPSPHDTAHGRPYCPIHQPMTLSRFWQWTAAILLAIVLIPFFLWEQPITVWVKTALEHEDHGPGLAFLLAGALALDILLPVPSSLLSTAAGYLLGFPLGALASSLGMTAGCMTGYGIGRFARESLVRRLLKPSELERVSESSKRWGDWAVVVLRPVPVLAEASVLAAGLVKQPFWRFGLLTALANAGVSTAYAAIGAYALETQAFLLAFLGAIVLPGLAMWALGRFRPGNRRRPEGR